MSTEIAKSPVKVHIRWMIRRDMPEVLDIENAGFDFPLTEERILKYLRERNTIGMVAEFGERVVGFMIYELRRDSLHVHDFAVAPDFRLRSVGRQMMAKLAGKLSVHRRTYITTAVRETNLAGCEFLASQGFLATRVEREYHEDTGEDAYVFVYDLAVATIADDFKDRGCCGK